MTYVEIYKNDAIIDKGIFIAGKHWRLDYPNQSIIIKNNKEEKEYDVENDKITFKEYNSNYQINYDSITHIDYEEQRKSVYYNKKVKCPNCNNITKRNDLRWINDRYGIPYKQGCNCCEERLEKEISIWEYDYMDVGEYL